MESPVANGDDDASNWPDALTANVAPTGGSAALKTQQPAGERDLVALEVSRPDRSVASANCPSCTSMEAATDVAETARLFRTSPANCAVCR